MENANAVYTNVVDKPGVKIVKRKKMLWEQLKQVSKVPFKRPRAET